MTIENAKRDGIRISARNDGSRSRGTLRKAESRKTPPLMFNAGKDRNRNPKWIEAPINSLDWKRTTDRCRICCGSRATREANAAVKNAEINPANAAGTLTAWPTRSQRRCRSTFGFRRIRTSNGALSGTLKSGVVSAAVSYYFPRSGTSWHLLHRKSHQRVECRQQKR